MFQRICEYAGIRTHDCCIVVFIFRSVRLKTIHHRATPTYKPYFNIVQYPFEKFETNDLKFTHFMNNTFKKHLTVILHFFHSILFRVFEVRTTIILFWFTKLESKLKGEYLSVIIQNSFQISRTTSIYLSMT